MKKIKYFTYIFIVMLLASSCIKEDSIGVVNPVSKIEMKQEIDSIYTLERWDTLRITLPEITQANQEKPLTYSWEIDYKEVSKEKDLVYVCENFGKFPARLKISNEDGFYFKHFELDVRYSYIKGLYILASHNQKTIISYLPEDVKGKQFEFDVYEKNNPHIEIGSEPITFFFSNTPNRQELYLSTGNPSALYRLNANMMTVSTKVDVEPHVTFITDNGLESSITIVFMFIMNNRVAEINYNQHYYTNPRQQTFEGMFGELKLHDKFYYWRTPDDRYTNGELYFDNLKSRMIIFSNSAKKNVQELFKGSFANMKMIDMFLVTGKKEFGAVLQDKESKEFSHVWFNPGYYNQYNLDKEIAPEIIFSAKMPISSEIGESSLIASSPSKNVMYYTSGNKIYAYNVLSKGNFPSAPLFVCGNKGEIASIFINEAEGKMYVGTNDGSASLQGSIYCYDINSNKLIWEKENITGEIAQLGYKFE